MEECASCPPNILTLAALCASMQKIDCQPNDGVVVKDAVTSKPFTSTTSNPVGRNGCYMRLPHMQYCLKVRTGEHLPPQKLFSSLVHFRFIVASFAAAAA